MKILFILVFLVINLTSCETVTKKIDKKVSEEEAHYMIINGFCRGIFKELPFEFAMEANQLLRVSLEGAVG